MNFHFQKRPETSTFPLRRRTALAFYQQWSCPNSWSHYDQKLHPVHQLRQTKPKKQSDWSTRRSESVNRTVTNHQPTARLSVWGLGQRKCTRDGEPGSKGGSRTRRHPSPASATPSAGYCLRAPDLGRPTHPTWRPVGRSPYRAGNRSFSCHVYDDDDGDGGDNYDLCCGRRSGSCTRAARARPVCSARWIHGHVRGPRFSCDAPAGPRGYRFCFKFDDGMTDFAPEWVVGRRIETGSRCVLNTKPTGNAAAELSRGRERNARSGKLTLRRPCVPRNFVWTPRPVAHSNPLHCTCNYRN